MSAITRIFNLLLLFAATAHANVHSSGMLEGTQQRFKFDALRALQSDAPDVCPDETAQVGNCILAVEDLECSLCQIVALEGVSSDEVDPNNEAEVCDAIKSSNYCSNFNTCINDKCPDACKSPVISLVNCALKESNCDDFQCSPGFKANAVTAIVTITAFLGW
eukprot:CAMPEP_0172308276 /NCGR_PEP_ID=MMETSP1058-20130122/8927_1 /TAXON_ID=83371 /ORGANISM="Detonula confervacea, Strain CCMP 353" /LENGTH=162 /DNA_ID=CAMNT_0013020657 /DNA_START=57 /DNA_END=542 /DNA_ORIENTATION=+